MEYKLRDLLDKTYELEGLLHLALKRDDSAKDFLRLISKKGKEISEICNNFTNITDEETKENTSQEETFSLDEYSIDEEPEEIPISGDIKKPYKEIEEKKELQIKENNITNRGRLVFSINERFRFRRELFDNSDADFNNTLALVASMENFEEAEDYFINEEGFDMSEPVVKEFMEIIKKYFK